MKRVAILVPESAVIEAVASPQYMFSAANQFMLSAGRQPMFEVQLVGCKKGVRYKNGMFCVNPSALLEEVKETDLVLIPALFGDMKTAMTLNRAAIGEFVNLNFFVEILLNILLCPLNLFIVVVLLPAEHHEGCLVFPVDTCKGLKLKRPSEVLNRAARISVK